MIVILFFIATMMILAIVPMWWCSTIPDRHPRELYTRIGDALTSAVTYSVIWLVLMGFTLLVLQINFEGEVPFKLWLALASGATAYAGFMAAMYLSSREKISGLCALDCVWGALWMGAIVVGTAFIGLIVLGSAFGSRKST